MAVTNTNTGTPNSLLTTFSNMASTAGLTPQTDGSGTQIATNTTTGDQISYDPSVQTATAGAQPAMMANMGGEQIAQYGNGAATVTGQNGNVLAVENGELYGMASGASSRTDLGAASGASGWQTALSQGYASSQGAQDLEKASTGGLGAVQSVQNEFGDGSSAGAGSNGLTGSNSFMGSGFAGMMSQMLALITDLFEYEFGGSTGE